MDEPTTMQRFKLLRRTGAAANERSRHHLGAVVRAGSVLGGLHREYALSPALHSNGGRGGDASPLLARDLGDSVISIQSGGAKCTRRSDSAVANKRRPRDYAPEPSGMAMQWSL